MFWNMNEHKEYEMKCAYTNMNGSFTWSPDKCEIPPIEFCTKSYINSLTFYDLQYLSIAHKSEKETSWNEAYRPCK